MDRNPHAPRPIEATADGLDTRAVHAGPGPDPVTGAVVPPIVQSTTYAQEALGVDRGFTYSRAANPTVSALETALAELEGMPSGLAFASGMAALTALVLTVLRSGGRVVCSDVVYGGTARLFHLVLSRFGVEALFVDTSDPDALEETVTPGMRLLLVESPANPTLKLTDLEAAAAVARRAGALFVVDNTFLTPVLQRPAALGADVVLHSTTKYIEGHNSAVGGALLVRDPELQERLDRVRKTTGAIQSPLDAWLTLRGLRTLPSRMRRHAAHTLEVARWLEAHPAVGRVVHPGLDSFPQAELARRQQVSGGGMVTFEVAAGARAGRAVVDRLRLCIRAENLGAVETLATHPATMTHADLDPAERRRLGISDGLIRLSVGLEDPRDVIADLEQALAVAPAARGTAGPARGGGR